MVNNGLKVRGRYPHKVIFLFGMLKGWDIIFFVSCILNIDCDQKLYMDWCFTIIKQNQLSESGILSFSSFLSSLSFEVT